MRNKQKIAVFDFDGTLSKKYISMGFLEYLYGKGLYSEEAYREQHQMLKANRSNELSYSDWVYYWAKAWARSIKGQNVKTVEERAERFFENFKENIYPISPKIIKFLKENNYKAICLSLGSFEVIRLAARKIRMDEVYATQVSNNGSIYRGTLLTDVHEVGGKKKVLEKFSVEMIYLKKILLHLEIQFQM